MKQPSVKVFDGVYKVVSIGYDTSGNMDSIWFLAAPNYTKLITRGSEIINSNGISSRKIQKPTHHPHHDYIVAPNLERLLVRN